jgi:hypothetical protein
MVAKKGLKKTYIDENVRYHVKKAFHFNKLSWKQSFFIIVFLMKKVLRYED